MPFTALIGENDREVQGRVHAILASVGATVTNAYNVSEGHQALARSLFDVVLVRTDLPDLTGLKITANLRAAMGPNAGAVVIGLANGVTIDLVRKCRNAGITVVVERPVIERQLLGALYGLQITSPPAPTAPPAPPPPAATAVSIAVFEALANALRIQLITVLSRVGPASATALARETTMSRHVVEFHLKALKRAKLVQSGRRGRETLFAARTEGLKAVAQWMIHFAARPHICPP